MRDLTGQRVALFIPCYVDQFAPQVGMATRDVLRRLGVSLEFPRDQTCCGQPLANMGCADDARSVADHFVSVFRDFDYVVCPSGSCTAMVRHQYAELLEIEAAVCARTYELCEFVVNVLEVDRLAGRFPHRVGLHQSCHALRELRLGSPSELVTQRPDPIGALLGGLEAIELVELDRRDECCGFGGTFSIEEQGVSTLMGLDRILDHQRAGAEIIASADMSCLLHLGGLLRRESANQKVRHVVEILASAMAAGDR